MSESESNQSLDGLTTSRWRLVIGVWWRSILIAIVGGGAIGALVGFGFWVADEADPGDVALAVSFGAFVGLLIGIVVGPLLGLLAVVASRRGPAASVRVLRWAAAVLVAGTLAVVLWPLLDDSPLIACVILGAGTIGAWVTGGRVLGPAGRRTVSA